MRAEIKKLINWFSPKQCLHCEHLRTDGLYLCPQCAEKVLLNDEGPITAEAGKKLKLAGIEKEVFLDGYETVTVFAPPVDSLIKALKYQAAAEAAGILGEWLWWWAKVPWEIDYVCHVPLHWRRFAERGFNQANLIAAAFCEVSSRKHLPLLERRQHTLNQAAADYATRKKQLTGIFGVREKFANEKIKGKKILVVDDVMTTGSTFNECARALKAAGCEAVYGLAIAKARIS